MTVEFKTVAFKAASFETKQDGELEIGVIEGYASTWEVDQGDDQIEMGAFIASIADYKARSKKVPAKYMHEPLDIIGGMNPDLMSEDANGLKIVMDVNLGFDDGVKCYKLAQQGVLTDFSIGYIVKKFYYKSGIRIITELKLIEVSLVDHPMNQGAIVTQVKGYVPYQELPVASAGAVWDEEMAIMRVREFTGSEDKPSADFKKAFLYVDTWDEGYFWAYELMVADVIDGQLMVIPDALKAAQLTMMGANGGVWISKWDIGYVRDALNKYLDKASMDAVDSDFGVKFDKSKVESWTVRDLEQCLKSTGKFSNAGVKAALSSVKKEAKSEAESTVELKSALRDLLKQQ